MWYTSERAQSSSTEIADMVFDAVLVLRAMRQMGLTKLLYLYCPAAISAEHYARMTPHT